MTPEHTPKQVSAERLQEHLSVGEGFHAFKTLTAAEVGSVVAELLTRRSSAGVKGLERFEPFADQDDGEFTGMGAVPDGDWVRYADVAALALPSHAGEDDGAVALPERDTSKPAEQQGLFRKFDVRRVDGSDAPGGKHHGCRYFVLDVDHDPHSVDALIAYAAACKTTHPELAKDLLTDWGLQSLLDVRAKSSPSVPPQGETK